MDIRNIKVGREVSSAEMDYILKEVIPSIRKEYDGPIVLVGSRLEHRVSRKSVDAYLGDMTEKNRMTHWNTMDTIIRKNDVPAKKIRETLDKLLPMERPDEIKRLLESPGPIDGDMDVLLTGLEHANFSNFEDPESGLVVEVRGTKDNDYMIVDNYCF